MGDSSILTSVVTNSIKPRQEEFKSNAQPYDYHKRILHANVPKANVTIDTDRDYKPANQKEEIHSAEQRNVNNYFSKEIEIPKQHTPLNRISEEVVQSGESVASKAAQQVEKVRNQSPQKSPTKGFQIQESYHDFVTFDDSDPMNKNSKFSEQKQQSAQKSAKKQGSKTHRENEKSNNAKRRQKLEQKRKLEKKLKELEELERLVMEKERKKKMRKWAVLVIQRWVRGHLARKQFELVKRDA